jgi:hypothetical protein
MQFDPTETQQSQIIVAIKALSVPTTLNPSLCEAESDSKGEEENQ